MRLSDLLKDFRITLVLTGLFTISSILSVGKNYYVLMASVIVAISSFLLSFYNIFNNIIIKLENIEGAVSFGEVRVGQRRPQMYETARELIEPAKRRILLIQKTPTLIFPIRKREGMNEERDFLKILSRKLEDENIEFTLLFNMFDNNFINEYKLYDDNEKKQIISNLKNYCKLTQERKKIRIASLSEKSYSVDPLIIADDKVAFWLTDLKGERLFISFKNIEVAEQLYGYYRSVAEELRWECLNYVNKFINIKKDIY